MAHWFPLGSGKSLAGVSDILSWVRYVTCDSVEFVACVGHVASGSGLEYVPPMMLQTMPITCGRSEGRGLVGS